MDSTTLRLVSSMATRAVLAELATQYQQATGQAVLAEAAGGVDVARRVEQGELFDVVVLAEKAIDKLIADDRLLPDTRAGVVKSGVAIAVKAGAPHPAVTDEEAVKRAVSEAASLSYSTGPSGLYLESLFEKWGILDEIRPRIVVPPPGTPVASLVASGEAALGFQQLSEMQDFPGIDVLGPLPPAIQTITTFVGAVSSNTPYVPAAQGLLDFLASPKATATKEKFGLEPG